jgi:hypothetical protein
VKRNGLGVEMKNLRLVISIVVILAIVCSPALAISSSDLIAQYRGQSATTIPTVVPTTTPTTAPTQVLTGFSPWTVSVTSTPTRAFVFIDGSYRGLTPVSIDGLSVGTHQLKVSRIGYEDYLTEIVIPEPECHMVWIRHLEMLICDTPSQTIDVTLKKIELPIPTIIRIPTTTPTTPISTGIQNGDPVLRLFLQEHPDIEIRFRQPTDVSD